jgi:hypothetical protein
MGRCFGLAAALAKLGASPTGSSPQQFDAKLRADYKRPANNVRE